jgi:hypothetical protein
MPRPSLRRAVLKRLVGYPVALAAVLIPFWWLSIRMPGTMPAADLPPLTSAEDSTRIQLISHVAKLSDTLRGRWAGSSELDSSAAYIERELASYGYRVERQVYAANGHSVRNLEVTRLGHEWPDSIVLVGAHYDAILDTPGADDNASGTAALLEVARAFRHSALRRTLRFVAFTLEEPPYFMSDSMGSLYYARAARARGDKIAAMISLESLGYYSTAPASQRYPPVLGWFYPSVGDFVAVVGNISSRQLVHTVVRELRTHTAVPSTGAATFAAFPGVAWSDHWSFWKAGYPAVMITGTATFRNPQYHLDGDTHQTLDYARLARVVHGVARVLRHLADR